VVVVVVVAEAEAEAVMNREELGNAGHTAEVAVVARGQLAQRIPEQEQLGNNPYVVYAQ
jgi:hypothetical protein